MVVYGIQNEQARKMAYPLLTWAARRHWGMKELPKVERGARGKPFFSEVPQCQFNVSHSGMLAVCALDEAPVGVDIQVVKKRRDAFLDRVCSERELDWLHRRGDRAEDFTRLWAMKESRCKYTGEGLRRPISGISVPLPEGEETVLEWEGLRFWLVRGEGWCFSLCGRGTWDGTIQWINADILDTRGD